MPTLAEEAAAAYAARQAEQEAARESERAVMRTAARDAVKAVLTRPDGTPVSLTSLGLTPTAADFDAGLFVWSDGSGFGLAAQRRDDDWRVVVVRKDSGRWVKVSEGLRELADAHSALGKTEVD